jgi:gas vesicle protein
MRNAFSNVTGYDIGSHFADGIKGGFTVGAGNLVKQMQDHLKSIQQLQDDAGKLAGLGYTQTFIDQVIAQGPKIGDQLAQALMKADPATTGSLQDLYASIQNTSAHGLDNLAAGMNKGGQLATEQLTDSYKKVGTDLKAQLDKITSDSKDAEAQIQTDLNTTLTQLAKDRDKSMADALQSYQNQMADMSTSYHNQLADAAQALSNSLADAATALNNKMADIMKSMLDSLKTINSALAGLGVKGVAGGSAYSPSTSAPLSAGELTGKAMMNASPTGYISGGALTGTGYSPVIGSLTQNVYTTDPSLPTITNGLTNAISVGQTQGLMSKPLVVSTQR